MQDHYQSLCGIINQVFAIESKLLSDEGNSSLNRKFQNIKNNFEAMHIFVHDPTGETYDETRLDCDASISGENMNDLKIIEVIKPVVYFRKDNINEIIQRAVVIAEGA